MNNVLKIGTRESQLAVWQAELVKNFLAKNKVQSELVYIKSAGDNDIITPLYSLGVEGIFTKTLDTALLNNRIDIAVHSMKDVPITLASGIKQAAILKRASSKDIIVVHGDDSFLSDVDSSAVIATSSIRRMAQWRHRYRNHTFENLRGNINTRLKKVYASNWNGAIFAAAGLERIGLRPAASFDLDWMLPAPAQGAIMVVCRMNDERAFEATKLLNDEQTALCTKIERDFLKAFLGGCSTPISALATIANNELYLEANICVPNGSDMIGIKKNILVSKGEHLGLNAAEEALKDPKVISMIKHIRNGK